MVYKSKTKYIWLCMLVVSVLKPKSNYMPPEQFTLLLDNVKELHLRKIKPEDVVMLFKIARYCGLRISEALRLEAKDIDTEIKEVTIRESKTSWEYCKCAKFETSTSFRGRKIKKLVGLDKDCKKCKGSGKIYIPDKTTIPKAFVKELEKYLENKEGPLFEGVTRFDVHYWLTELGKKLNIAALTTPQSETHEKTKCHIFRKSIGKDMHMQGISLNTIMGKMRHSSLDTTTEYLKLKTEDIKLAEENLTL